jgi:FMN reductase
MSAFTPTIVGIGGTLRKGSSSELVLRRALSYAAALGARTEIFASADLDLPIYREDRTERGERELRLVDAMRRCDGLIFSSPSYHGSISGLLKNALDYAEDLRNDGRVYLDGRPVGCIAVALGPQAGSATLQTLRTITHALRGWPTPAGGCINTSGAPFGTDGRLSDPLAEKQLKIVATQVVEFACMHNAVPSHDSDLETDRFQPPRAPTPLNA